MYSAHPDSAGNRSTGKSPNNFSVLTLVNLSGGTTSFEHLQLLVGKERGINEFGSVVSQCQPQSRFQMRWHSP